MTGLKSPSQTRLAPAAASARFVVDVNSLNATIASGTIV